MRLALVVPRYGEDLVGGAESLARGLAEQAIGLGWVVEIWTTCAHDHFTWENQIPAGLTWLNKVPVRRFPVTSFDRERHSALEMRLAASGSLSVSEQYEWLESAAHSTALYAHVARHASEFDAIIALPYAMPLVHYASWVAPESVLFWPCLHDEPYAYFEPVRLLMESVLAVLFNSPEESHLATTTLRIHLSRAAVLGVGVALELSVAGSLEPTEQYLAYVGRLEEGKNVRLLYDYARRYFAEGHNIRLLVCGKGPLEPPRQPAFIFRGVVDEQEKAAVYGNAMALCQPSLNESFSLTMMESWLAGRPVLVSEGCAVTRGHVRRSKGGLWFSSYGEFAGALDWLAANRELADRMGENGRAYVRDNFTWSALTHRLAQLLTEWQAT